MNSGHVFILHADLRRLACDAWLMPCGIEARPEWYWWTAIESARDFTWPEPPERWGMGQQRAFKVSPYPRDLPQPWLVNVGGSWNLPIAWYLDGVREFMSRVARDLDGGSPRFGRARHLVALPVVGTGAGGMRHRTGEVVRSLLPLLYESAATYGIDIALVVLDAPDYAAAQGVRLRLRTIQGRRWPELDEPRRQAADALAQVASRGDLVVFLGSGISQAAGLPTWGQMLRQLAADRLEIDTEALSHWSYADQARILERGFGGREAMIEAVIELCSSSRYAPSHAMLAALPVDEFVTTNYDRLFELASEAIGRRAASLPYESASKQERWVLKMHGCITHPDDIVLTREDYLRYASRRSALAGIVQALLITKHMLFLGFSLDDDNFQRIADDVRQVVRETSSEEEPFGTAILLHARPFLVDLWRGEIDLVLVEDQDLGLAPAARRFEILLDYLLAQVHDPTYLLNDRFLEVLSPQERALRDKLWELIESPTELRQSPSWAKVAELLRALGWQGI